MKLNRHRMQLYFLSIIMSIGMLACANDSANTEFVDPFAPAVFKEQATSLPKQAPNPAALIPFYVSKQTVFEFAIDPDSILIGTDGVTRYSVVITNPSGGKHIQYEGIRCDSYQWRLYGTFDNDKWQENPLGTWKEIKRTVPNRYQAALASGAFCNLNTQEKSIRSILRSLDPKNFSGGTQPTNSFGIGSY